MWIDSGEGPWCTREEAEAFAEAEVGMPYRIVERSGEYAIECIDPDGSDEMPDLWLEGEDGEQTAVAGCGCYLVRDLRYSGDPAFFMCSVHAAAPMLLAALKGLLPMWESGISEPCVAAAKKAIAIAQGASSCHDHY